MKRPTELIEKIKQCSNGEFQNLYDYIFFLENLTKTQKNKTIDECFKAMRQKVDEVFQRQTEERHEKDLSAYQQPFDCFSMGTIEFEILSEVEEQMKEKNNENKRNI